MKQFLAFVGKEVRHILRDRRTIMILMAMPVIQIVLFGFALSNEVKDVRLAVVNHSGSYESQTIINTIEQSEYFEVVTTAGTVQEVDLLLKSAEIDAALVFPSDFGTTLTKDGSSNIQVIADATDPNTSSMYVSYISGIVSQYSMGIKSQQMPSNSIITNLRLLYNPTMEASYNFVPGVLGLILTMICAMMTSISIVRERERGTMEVLLVSPIRPLNIIIAKSVPYFTMSCVILVMVLLLSRFVLGVPIMGSLALLVLMSLIFIFAALGIGLLISSIVDNQTTAMLASGMLLMMPTMSLTGVMFPFENLPLPLQIVGSALPAKWYISATRKIMIQGLPFEYLYKEFFVLLSMAVVLITISFKKFKTRL